MLPFAAWRGEVEAAEEYRDRLIPKTDSNPVVKVAQGDGAKEGGEAARSELAPMTVTGAADAPFTK
ncbi:hypothetical protein NOC27_2551 [Nitrosococcus oceani AFC27]|nr:hypothetical protein NOC27_2551 [Nitrosococcus oceani AFC27]